MWNYHTLCLVVIVCLAVNSVEANMPCSPQGYILIQETCRTENNDLLKAQKDHDKPKAICQPLMNLLMCTARIGSTQCLQEIIGVYSSYLHSPHNCSMSSDFVRELQDLANRNAGQQGGGGGGGGNDDTGDVKIIPLDTSPSPSTTADDSSADNDDDDDGGGGGGGGSVTVGDNRTGDTHKHTGNTGSSISLFCGVPAVMSWLATLRMTSYLLRS